MARETATSTKHDEIISVYTGRRIIRTDADIIDDANVNAVVENAYITHMANRSDISYLYKYFKGDQPILTKVKEVRPEINEKVVINLANEIVSFWVGYLVGKPVQYVSSVADETVSAVIARLNDMMRNEGKVTKDRRLVEWQMICGTGYRLALPKKRGGEKVPWEFYTLDPRNAFVIRANDYTDRTLAGVSYREDENGSITFTVYTEDKVYTIEKGTGRFTAEANTIGYVPIIEYPANSARLGVFEVVLSILDAVNELDSNRLDAVKQFVESLLIVYNAEFPDDVTANEIRQSGMVQLHSTGEANADIKVISEKLDQTNTETLKQSLLEMIHEIVGLPSQGNGNTGDSSNNGAVILKNGWQGAETRAEAYEAEFYEPEMQFLRIVSAIADSQGVMTFDPEDIDIRFTRRNYEDILAKSQTLTTLLQNEKVHPQKAYEASGLFIDSEEAYRMGMTWYEEHRESTDEPSAGGRTEYTADEADGTPFGVSDRRDNREAQRSVGTEEESRR